MTPIQLIERLTTDRGAIVSSGNCSEIEIAAAQATGRFAVNSKGYGFVWRYPEWLNLAQHLVSAQVRPGSSEETGAANSDRDALAKQGWIEPALAAVWQQRARQHFDLMEEAYNALLGTLSRVERAALMAKLSDIIEDPDEDKEDPKLVGYPQWTGGRTP